MKKYLGKKLLIMLIISVVVGMISQSWESAPSFSSKAEHFGYVVGYIGSFALSLIIVSFLVALIPCLAYWLLNKKRAPNIIITAWYFWIAMVTIIFFFLIYKDNIITPEEAQVTETKSLTNAKSVYNKVSNSIYTINNKDKNNNIISSGGAVAVTKFLLATNCHIINKGDHFTITIGENEEIGRLYSQHGDLCVVKVGNKKFTPIEIRHSKTVEIGEDVYAVGNPEGFEKSISKGIISNKYNNEGIIILQTDAAISPGSSGGGLFDRNGKLIGITTTKWAKTLDEGIGFVIPTETIQAAILEPRKKQPTASSKQSVPVQNPRVDSD